MIKIFDFINDILFSKKGSIIDTIDNQSQYNPYMINRWLSMYSPDIAQLINSTVNKWHSIFETKKDNYRLLITLIPKSKWRKINYIKKKTKTSNSEKEQDDVPLLAKNLELSEREVNMYKELQRCTNR